MLFITPAFAADAATASAPASAGDMLTSMLPILLVLAVFYFMVMRPQNTRFREHKQMIDNLKKGDQVVTGGGLIATVKNVGADEEVTLELADGVQVRALRGTIMSVRKK